MDNIRWERTRHLADRHSPLVSSMDSTGIRYHAIAGAMSGLTGLEPSGPANAPSEYRTAVAGSAVEDPAFCAGQRVVSRLILALQGPLPSGQRPPGGYHYR
jgi:hypothetical protein